MSERFRAEQVLKLLHVPPALRMVDESEKNWRLVLNALGVKYVDYGFAFAHDRSAIKDEHKLFARRKQTNAWVEVPIRYDASWDAIGAVFWAAAEAVSLLSTRYAGKFRVLDQTTARAEAMAKLGVRRSRIAA